MEIRLEIFTEQQAEFVFWSSQKSILLKTFKTSESDVNDGLLKLYCLEKWMLTSDTSVMIQEAQTQSSAGLIGRLISKLHIHKKWLTQKTTINSKQCHTASCPSVRMCCWQEKIKPVCHEERSWLYSVLMNLSLPLCFMQPLSGPKMPSLTTSWQRSGSTCLRWCPNTSSRSRSVHEILRS